MRFTLGKVGRFMSRRDLRHIIEGKEAKTMKKNWCLIPGVLVVLALGAVGCAPGGNQGVISIPAQQNAGIW